MEYLSRLKPIADKIPIKVLHCPLCDHIIVPGSIADVGSYFQLAEHIASDHPQSLRSGEMDKAEVSAIAVTLAKGLLERRPVRVY